MMDSLALSDTWDLTLTAGGNLAVTSGLARVAQDVACYERTFQGEPWYASEDGVPYLVNELGSLPPAELVRERAVRRALEVPGVAAASVELTEFAARVLRGRIRVTVDGGGTADVTI